MTDERGIMTENEAKLIPCQQCGYWHDPRRTPCIIPAEEVTMTDEQINLSREFSTGIMEREGIRDVVATLGVNIEGEMVLFLESKKGKAIEAAFRGLLAVTSVEGLVSPREELPGRWEAWVKLG